MLKDRIKAAVGFILLAGILCGCAAVDNEKPSGLDTVGEQSSDLDTADGQSSALDIADGQPSDLDTADGRPSGLDISDEQVNSGSEAEKTAQKSEGETYTIEPDLSNIENQDQFYFQDEAKKKLAQNGFVVMGSAGSEFFEVYDNNRYWQIPNFITVDSLMHTYHLYFSYLQKSIEKEYLADKALQLSRKMQENSITQYELLKGSEWEDAAKRNVAFFTVGVKLLDDSAAVEDYVSSMVNREIAHIVQAEEIAVSEITDTDEDYTQYIPRGYYEGDEALEQYFRAMMWYGRMHFIQESQELDRSAMLITKALMDDPEGYELWDSIYTVTSFFTGSGDDLGVNEYKDVIKEVYGEEFAVEELAGKQDAFDHFHAMTKLISVPQMNSVPLKEGEDNVIPGFRFMGQRFTIDGAIMQRLIYSQIGENARGEKRMLPDVLDVPAALGSDKALEILREQGAMEYAGYAEAMEELREELAEDTEQLWSASLYAGWLNVLRPMLLPKGEEYPVFMQNEEWMKRSLECFAGSFAELKHDTILYARQVTAETGGDGSGEWDDSGYVEPEPLVYFRFNDLASRTAEGLKQYGMLSEEDERNLNILAVIANNLFLISQKELENEELSAEDYDFIRYYGGHIEHIWYQAVSKVSDSQWVDSKEYPAALVTDIATNLEDPDNCVVLEAATGNPSRIYVAVKVDGKLKIATGSVYSFYQFSWPAEDRLTDSRWRYKMGLEADEDGNYSNEPKPVQKPAWTESYRYILEGE